MSVGTELQRLIDAKAAIRAAIQAQGVTVDAGLTLDAYAARIALIEGGAPVVTEPDAFVTGNWTLTPIAGGIRYGITALPADGGSAITDIQETRDAGTTWTSLGGTTTGDYDVTGLPETLQTTQIRAVNAVNPGDPSDVKTATPLEAAAPGSVSVSGTTGTVDVLSSVTFDGVSGTAYRLLADGSTITFTGSGPVNWLYVAGGGPGGTGTGSTGAGGGGAGEVLGGLPSDVFTAVAGTYTAAIGTGGVAASGAGSSGGSTFLTGTNAPTPAALGGGRGASDSAGSVALAAASEGGGGSQSSSAGGVRTATGFRGGNASAGNAGGAGGGGAGAQGGDIPGWVGDAGSNGGVGLLRSITGTETYYGGGGAGADPQWQASTAAGGLGGGAAPGAGTGDRAGLPGTANTGGGGSGGSGTGLGGDGGSGVIVIFVPA